MDLFLCDLSSFLIHSKMEEFGQYLEIITFPHKELGFFISLHGEFAAKYLQNSFGFLISYPPIFFGEVNVDHLTKGMPFASLLVVHRKETLFP